MKIEIFTSKPQEAKDVLESVLDDRGVGGLGSYDGPVRCSIEHKNECIEVMALYRLKFLCERLIRKGVISSDIDLLIDL